MNSTTQQGLEEKSNLEKQLMNSTICHQYGKDKDALPVCMLGRDLPIHKHLKTKESEVLMVTL